MASDGFTERKSLSMLSAMYRPMLFVKPTANVPTVIVRMVRMVRILFPQKSAQTFFQRLRSFLGPSS